MMLRCDDRVLCGEPILSAITPAGKAIRLAGNKKLKDLEPRRLTPGAASAASACGAAILTSSVSWPDMTDHRYGCLLHEIDTCLPAFIESAPSLVTAVNFWTTICRDISTSSGHEKKPQKKRNHTSGSRLGDQSKSSQDTSGESCPLVLRLYQIPAFLTNAALPVKHGKTL